MANATDGAAPAARSLYGAATPAVVVQPGAHQLHSGGAPAKTPAEGDAGDAFEHWSEAGQYAPRQPGEAPPPDPAAPRQTRVADAPLLDEGPRRSNASTSDGFVLEPPEGPRADPRAGYAPAGGAVGGGRGQCGHVPLAARKGDRLCACERRAPRGGGEGCVEGAHVRVALASGGAGWAAPHLPCAGPRTNTRAPVASARFELRLAVCVCVLQS